MAGICLFTDSSAILPDATPSEIDPVHIIPLVQSDPEARFPTPIHDDLSDSSKITKVPTEEWFVDQFQTILQKNYGILGIFHSSALSECYHRALDAAALCKGGKDVVIIDSHTLGPGLGILIRTANRLIRQNYSLRDIDRKIRGMISKVFTVISTTEAHYLYKNSYISYAQAVVNDMLGLIPIFSLEQNGLYPLDKVRSFRQIFEYYQGFVSEFDNPQQIALMLSAKPPGEDQKLFFDFVCQNYPGVGFSISTTNDTNKSFFGTYTTALFLVDGNMDN